MRPARELGSRRPIAPASRRQARTAALLVSRSPYAVGAEALDRSTLTGAAYVYVLATGNVRRVVFFFDGRRVRTDRAAPYDFAGGRAAAPRPWRTARAVNGTHTIVARIYTANGGRRDVSAKFTITNAAVVRAAVGARGHHPRWRETW